MWHFGHQTLVQNWVWRIWIWIYIADDFSKEPIINDPSSAMTKKQRKIFSKGAEELQENDEVVI